MVVYYLLLLMSRPGRKKVHPVKKREIRIMLTVFVLINIHYLPPVGEYLLEKFKPKFKPFSVITGVFYTVLCQPLELSHPNESASKDKLSLLQQCRKAQHVMNDRGRCNRKPGL